MLSLYHPFYMVLSLTFAILLGSNIPYDYLAALLSRQKKEV